MTPKRTKVKKATPIAAQLLLGEKITFQDEDVEHVVSDEQINSRYVKGDMRIVTESARYSLAGILAMLQERVETNDGSEPELRYMLDPEYQRRHRWSDDRKSRLIESFLMNVPVPPVFLYERDLARFEVMDGRQRLTALSQFYNNEFALVGLQYWPELDGRKYSELPSKVRHGIDRRYISAIILLKETAPDEEQAAQLKKIVFERLNSGGVALSPQETRNAVYDGPLSQLCLDLAKNANFCAMWRIPIPSDVISDPTAESEVNDAEGSTDEGRRIFERMDDVELVLRFFAYRQIDSFPGGLNKIAAFLDRFLAEGNKNFERPLLDTYRDMFERTITFLYSVLGADAFCRLDATGKPLGRPTKILYDPLMLVASAYVQRGEHDQFMKRPDVLRAALGSMYEKNKKPLGGRSTNAAQVRERNQLMEEAFRTALAGLRR